VSAPYLLCPKQSAASFYLKSASGNVPQLEEPPLTLPKVPLGNTGDIVSILGCGTMWFRKLPQSAADESLNHCLDSGISYFDCARDYGDAEIKVGRAISHRKNEFFIATKTHARDANSAYREINESRSRLQVDQIDLLQLHYVNHQSEFDQIVSSGGALEGALRAQTEGLIRHIGITGHRPEKLAQWLESELFSTVLFHLNPTQPFAGTTLLPTTRRLGIGTMAMRPIGSGVASDYRMALRYVRGHSPDVIVSGLTSPAIVDSNIKALEEEVTATEFSALQAKADSIGNNGCRRCNYCECPVGIEIPDTLIAEPYWAASLMSEQGRNIWAEATGPIHSCADYEPCKTTPLCEQPCPYNLPIRDIILSVSDRIPNAP